MKGLHQDTTVGSIEVKDTWEPLEEGLDVYAHMRSLCCRDTELRRVVTSRHVSTITVVLSLQPLNPNSPGYQPPLPADQVHPQHRGGTPLTHPSRCRRRRRIRS